MKKVHKITYSHPGFREYFLSDGVAPDKLIHISNGANSDIFSFQGDKVVLSDKKLNLVYAGGIDRYHNVLLWIEVMKHLKNDDIHLQIVGSGNAAEEVKQAIDKYQLDNVTFLNRILQQKEIATYFRSADYSLVSVNEKRKVLWNVSIPTKAYESLSCGTPVISVCGESLTTFLEKFPPSINFDTTSGIDYNSIAKIIRKMKGISNKTHEDIAKKFQSKYSFQVLSKVLLKVMMESLDDFNMGETP